MKTKQYIITIKAHDSWDQLGFYYGLLFKMLKKLLEDDGVIEIVMKEVKA